MATTNEIIDALIRAEMAPGCAPDKRRVLRDERLALQAAVQVEFGPRRTAQVEVCNHVGNVIGYRTVAVPPDTARIARLMDEAIRTAAMWGVEI